ncbi:MAG: flagellar hook-associated protein FlgL [Dehalococcoidia bacterium]
MRISSNWLTLRTLSQIQGAQNRMVDAQERSATGKRITKPSDDPVATGRVLGLLTRGANNDQYARNVTIAGQDLAATEAALGSIQDLLARAHELSIEASNDTLSGSERSKIAVEVGTIVSQAVAVANQQHGDRFLFAGYRTATKPFTEDIPGNPTAVAYNGDTGLIEREIAQGERVTANITGDQFFPQLFSRLIAFRDALTANDTTTIRSSTGDLKTSIDEGLTLRADLGARVRRVEAAGQRHEDEHVLVESMRSSLEDVDLADAIVKLQQQQTTYQAALSSAGRTLQLSLLDFLR